MFNQPINLRTDDVTAALAIIDGPQNRRTLRASADGVIKMSIAHQESNENPGFTNQRSNLRVTESVPLDDTDKTLGAYVQMTWSFPKDHFNADKLRKLTGMMIGFLINAENSGGSDGIDHALLTAVTRLHAGEP